MENGVMFFVGISIFVLYIVGYLTMVSRQNKIQSNSRNSVDLKIDVQDFDGHGNWGRFTSRTPVRRQKKYKKTL
jgi:hypothetical protein